MGRFFWLDTGVQTQDKWGRVKTTCPGMSATETMGEFPCDITPSENALEHRSNNMP